VSSSQPLNLVVTEASSGSGGALSSTAYNVSPHTSNLIYNPLNLNGNFGGFTTNIYLYNAGNITSTGSISYFDQSGNQVAAATDTFAVPPHAAQSFNQSGKAGLSSSLSYWSVVSATTGSQLVSQVEEFGPNNFVAIYNGTASSSQTVFMPTAYNNALGGFNTGAALVNPNSSSATVSIKYYDAATGVISATQSLSIPANGILSSYTPLSGVPAGFTGSAIITSNQPLVALVNEQGAAASTSGTYIGLSQASQSIGLPAVANGFVGFTTGTTILNVTDQPIEVTLEYYNSNGTALSTSVNYTVAPYASALAYQGGGAAGLPSGFFGTAVLSSNVANSLVATTNAAANGLFYTYTEPAQ
jgi:hypothetical protein